MKRTYYYTKEVCAMLHITEKTLYRWCRSAEPPIEPEPLPSVDGRWTVYRPQQIERLAALHSRVINEDAPLAGVMRYPVTMKAAIAEMQEQIDAVTRQINHLRDERPELGDLAEMRAALAEVQRLKEQMGMLEQEREARHQPSVLPPAPAPIPSLGGEYVPRKPRDDTSSQSQLPPLPAEMMSVNEVCLNHSMPRTTVWEACRKGLIQAHRGKWLHSHSTVTMALDPQELRLFYNYYHRHPRFTSCPECPHDSASLVPASWAGEESDA